VFTLLGLVAQRSPSGPLAHGAEKGEPPAQLLPHVRLDLEQLDRRLEPGLLAEGPEVPADGAEAIGWDFLSCLGGLAGHVGGDRCSSHASRHGVVLGVEDGPDVDPPPGVILDRPVGDDMRSPPEHLGRGLAAEQLADRRRPPTAVSLAALADVSVA